MPVQTEVVAETGRAEFKRLCGAKEWGQGRALCFKMLARSESRLETFRWLENYAVCEWGRGDLFNALAVLTAAAELLDDIADDHLLGNHFNNLALVNRALGRNDEALIHYAGAGYHYGACGREDLQASVLNNRGFLFVKVGRAEKAVGLLKEAAAIYQRLGMWGHAAEVYDSLKLACEALAATGEG